VSLGHLLRFTNKVLAEEPKKEIFFLSKPFPFSQNDPGAGRMFCGGCFWGGWLLGGVVCGLFLLVFFVFFFFFLGLLGVGAVLVVRCGFFVPLFP